jgi:hypothetical protein
MKVYRVENINFFPHFNHFLTRFKLYYILYYIYYILYYTSSMAIKNAIVKYNGKNHIHHDQVV